MILELKDSQYIEGKESDRYNVVLYCQLVDALKKSISENDIELFSLSNRRKKQYFNDELVWYEINDTRNQKKVVNKATFYTSHYIGFYSTKIDNTQVSLEIKPRFGDGIFNYLLSYAYGIYLPKSDFSSSKSKNGNLWLIVMMWKSTLEKAMTKSQIPKEYKSYERNSSNFKGQLKISQHIKHNLVDKSKFYCKYRKLTMDTIINQTIRYTYKLLMQKQKNLSGLLRNIAEYDAMLQSFGVENKDVFLSEIKNIRYSKLNFHYKKVMELSSLIIKSESTKSDSSLSNNNSFSYFLDIAELWENYLLKLLQKNLPEYHIYSPNEDGGEYLLENEYRQIRPDIMIEKNGIVVAILDAKYKMYNEVGKNANSSKCQKCVSRDDLYQMTTYLYHYADKNKKVIGLFVSPIEDEGKIETFSKNTKHKIGVINLDIEQFTKKYHDKKELEDNFSLGEIQEEEKKFIEKIKKALHNDPL